MPPLVVGHGPTVAGIRGGGNRTPCAIDSVRGKPRTLPALRAQTAQPGAGQSRQVVAGQRQGFFRFFGLAARVSAQFRARKNVVVSRPRGAMLPLAEACKLRFVGRGIHARHFIQCVGRPYMRRILLLAAEGVCYG
jgi:hypothetical protein